MTVQDDITSVITKASQVVDQVIAEFGNLKSIETVVTQAVTDIEAVVAKLQALLPAQPAPPPS